MRLSIITINYNNADGLRKTMESVFAQTYRDFEYIVVDGASSDGSVDVIRELASSNPLTPNPLTLTWSSEPDTGIYNAMNKGVRKATGEYVLMLNSGDYFVDEHVVERVLPELDGTDIIQGNVISVKDGMESINRGYGKSDLTFIDVMLGNFLHQASFCRREIFDTYGYFDESFRIGGDTVFYAKCLGFGDATFKYIDQNIAYFDGGGVSAASSGKWYEIHKEENLRYEKMFSRRMWQMWAVEQNKIRMYDRLHAHWWSWKLTKVISFLENLIYRNQK